MVPEGWTRGVFEDGIELISGQHVEAEYVNNSGIGKPYLTGPADFPSGKIIVSKFTVEGKKFSQKGDLLITVKGSGTGKVIESDDSYAISRQLMAIRPQKFDRSFVFYNLLASISRYEGAAAGLIPGISRDDVLHTPILIPPLPEQRKIAAILSTWDKAITTTEQLLANSQQQKKALMQQLLTGKKRFNSGVEYDFSVREGFTKGKLGALPNDWKVELINQHLWYQEGPGVRNYQFKTSGVKLFNGTNIQFNQIVLDNTTTFISEDECNGPYKHFLVDDGDLLIACSGISVDRFDEKIAFATQKHLPLCMNTSTMRFKPLSKGRVDIKFFQFFMQSWVFKNQIRRQATGSAQLNFGPSHIGKCYVLIPPLVEQQKIASVLTAADEEISALQQKIEVLKQEKKALMQQLLTGKRRVKVDEVAAWA